MTYAEATEATADIAAGGAQNGPKKAKSQKVASQKKGASKSQKAAKAAKDKSELKKQTRNRAAEPAQPARMARAESKGAKVLELIGRPKGATLPEIVKATNWQAHTVRGFISTAAKKQGIRIVSSKSEAGDRVYQIAK